jgi:Zn-dependent protease with chaperone function
MIDIKSLRHEKEALYLTLMQILGGLFWIIILFGTVGLVLIYILLFTLALWLAGLYFKAEIYGNSVKVSPNQYPQIYKLVIDHSNNLNLPNTPDVFIYNGSGLVNAFAVKFLSKKYVILMSNLVDLMLKREKIEELSVIIGHELGHHAAGHTNPWRNLLIKPASLIPFLGAAYSRSCELTADRIGYMLTGNLTATQNALVATALGSESIASDTNVNEFVKQENEIPEIMGVVHKIFSTHPRMTKRIIEIQKFNNFKIT